MTSSKTFPVKVKIGLTIRLEIARGFIERKRLFLPVLFKVFFFFSFYFVNLTDVSDILTELFLYFFRFFLSLANSNYTTDLRSPFEYRFI